MSTIEINKIYQLITTFLSLILTAVLPLIVFLLIGSAIKIYLANVEFIMSMIIIIGILATSARYFIYQYPQFSKKRALFSLFNSMLLLIYFGFFSLLSSLGTLHQTTYIAISFQGVFFLLSLPWIVFLIRDIYNLVDFSLHEEDYITLARKQKFELKTFVRCSRCGYKVKIGLKRCPRCRTPLQHKSS